MALKGQKRRFADAVLAAKPRKISNREAALQIGCSETSASASGSRCAADKDVRDYIRAHWPDYYGEASPETQSTEHTAKAAAIQNALPLFNVRDVQEWLGSLHPESAELSQIIKTICDKLKITGEVMDYWRGVMLDPWADGKEKMAASENIARYTLAKPASKTKKEEEADKARQLREQRKAAQYSIFDDTPQSSLHPEAATYKGKVPKWN